MKYKNYYDRLKDKKTLIVLFLIVILGSLLRLYHLDSPSLWWDEIATASKVGYSLPQTVKYLFVSPFPPLYYIIMNLWLKIFRISEFSLRFPSLIFSVLSIIFIFKLSRELFDEKIGLISALLLSVSPYSINYAQDAKMYAMLWFLGILSFLFFHRFTKDNKTNSLFLYVIFTTMSIYTLYVGFIFIIIQNILFFSFFNAKQLKKWLLGQLMIILLFIPWIDKFLYNAVHKTGIGWIPEIDNYLLFSGKLFLFIMGIIIGKESPIMLIELFLYWFLIVSAIMYFENDRHKWHIFSLGRNDCLIFAWIIVPIVIYWLIDVLAFPIFYIRYVGFIHVPLIILISKGLNKYNIKIKSVILLFLLFIIFSYHLHPYYKDNLKIEGEDWRGLFNRVHERADGNDLIISKLPDCIIRYYGKGTKANLVSYDEIKGKDIDKKYDSIFVIYRNHVKPNIKEPAGYKLKEIYHDKRIGFLWLKKS